MKTTELKWTEFRKFLDGTYARLRFHEESEKKQYRVTLYLEGDFYGTRLLKDPSKFIGVDVTEETADRDDYVSNWQSEANTPPPRTSDGRDIVIPVLFRGDLNTMFCGVGDDIGNGDRFVGQKMQVSSAVVEDKVIEWQHMEWIYIAGGLVQCSGAVLGDTLKYEIIAPASVGTSNVGSGAYGKLDIGGGVSMYVNPATPGADGPDWDLNIVETLNGNVGFSKVVPVPTNPEGTGFFDWDPDTETVTYDADEKGNYNLFDGELNLGLFVPYFNLLGSEKYDLLVSSTKPKRLLAQWKHKVTLHNSSAKTLEAVWNLFKARKENTP